MIESEIIRNQPKKRFPSLSFQTFKLKGDRPYATDSGIKNTDSPILHFIAFKFYFFPPHPLPLLMQVSAKEQK